MFIKKFSFRTGETVVQWRKGGGGRNKWDGKTMRVELPFVLLPKVKGEGAKQHCSESSHPSTKPNPELHTLTKQCFLFRQGHTSRA